MSVVTDVGHCARCGEDHLQLKFAELAIPVECDCETMTHWTLCPNTDEPILLGYKENLLLGYKENP